MEKKLYRTEGKDAVIGGVCGGIAEYIGIDPNIIRLITAALLLLGGLSLWVYVLAVLIVPKKSKIYPGY